MANLPIVDGHQHFWDLTRNDLPWLRNEPLIPFRYGDYSAIRRNYLPEDYRRGPWYVDLVNEGLFWFSSRGTVPAEVSFR